MTQASPSGSTTTSAPGGAVTTTPRADGFTLPARFEPHQRHLLSWPCREDLFGPLMDDARKEWAEVARGIARFEPVTVVVDPAQEDEARALLTGAAAVGAASGSDPGARLPHRPPPHPPGRLVDPRQRAHLRAWS